MGARPERGRSAVAVVGGGPAGLGAAYGLVQRGIRPVLLEAGESVGGLARSIELWDEAVDLGAHLLQRNDRRIVELWDAAVGDAYDAVPRRTAVLAGAKRYAYPYEPGDVARALGPWLTARCVASFAAARFDRQADDGNLESWVVRRFGRRLFELFVRDYVQKLTGLPARELDSALATTLVGFRRHPSLVHAARRGLGRASDGAAVPLIVRPHGGVGALMDSVARLVRQRGGVISCGAAVRRLGSSARGVEIETTQRAERFAAAIVTLPLPVVALRLATPPPHTEPVLRAMQARNLVLAYLLVGGPRPFAEQWVYLHSPELRFGRVANFGNWAPGPARRDGTAVLAAEAWCDETSALWTSPDQDVAALAAQELASAGLLEPSRVLDSHVERVPNAFPVLRRGDTAVLQAAARHIEALPKVTLTSRPQAAVNVGVHGSLLLGIEAAERIAIDLGR